MTNTSRISGLLVVCFLMNPLLMAQQQKKDPPPPAAGQNQVDAAIAKGVKFLIKRYDKGITPASEEFELVLYTLIHADVNPQDSALLKGGIEQMINHDYFKKNIGNNIIYRLGLRNLALHAMLVNIANGVKGYAGWKPKADLIQKKIAESAQALVDSQLANGIWTYRGLLAQEPEAIKDITTGKWNDASHKENKAVAKEAWHNAAHLTGVLYRLKPLGTTLVKPGENQRGDNSNAQYAILGLMAAQYSGVEVPRSTWEQILKWFENKRVQMPEGGFGYDRPITETVQAGALGVYGAMTTVGAVGLAAANKYLGKDFTKEERFKKAMDWLAKHFSVSEHPGMETSFLYYYLYGLERVAAFAKVDKIGTHDWYAEGAAVVVKNQRDNGEWLSTDYNKSVPVYLLIQDTCFAILFLKRATRHFIDTGEKYIDSGPGPNKDKDKPIDNVPDKKEDNQ